MRKKYSIILDKYFCGFVTSELTGAFIRKTHTGILSHKQADALLKGKVSSGVRKAITLSLIDKGYLFTRNISFNTEVWFGLDDKEQFLLADPEDGLLQAKLLPLDEWKQVTAEIHGDEWKEALWPKRRRLILNTIRHEMGYYDNYIRIHGIEEACRLFLQYICKYYPELKSGLDDFSYRKESSGVVIADDVQKAVPEPVTDELVDYLSDRIQEREKVRKLTPDICSNDA